MKGFFTMKKITKIILSFLLALICVLSIVGCGIKDEKPADSIKDGETIETEGLWKDAKYRTNTKVGKGEKTIKFTVEADGKSLTITLKTDKATLGEAMFAEKLINDPSFFNVLNGIEASWEKDQAYWAFYKGDTLMPHGVNDEKISGGESYRFVYTK